MNIGAINNNGPTDPVALKKTGETNQDRLESEKKRLFKAAKEMESLFLYQLLKTMRKTIPQNTLGSEGAISSSNSKDVYTQMFDTEMAKMMSGKTSNSIASMLYHDMERTLNAEFGIEPDGKTDIKSLLPEKNYFNVNKISKAAVVNEPQTTLKLGNKIDRFDKMINRISGKYNLDPNLIKSVIKAESDGNTHAISKAGAKGLMQLTDGTAREMGVRDVHLPADNINGGAKYLKQMIDRFGDIKLGLAAYNAGPGNVKKYGGVPPFKETENYIEKVMKMAGS